MRKEKLLWIFIIVLILVNGATLFFMLSGRRPAPGDKFDRTITEVLQLNQGQIRQFNIMKREHHQEMIRVDREMRSNYEKYFYLLSDTGNILKKDSLGTVLGNNQKEKIQITYQHFNELKSICTSEQKEKFKELIPLLMQVIDPKKNPFPSRRN